MAVRNDVVIIFFTSVIVTVLGIYFLNIQSIMTAVEWQNKKKLELAIYSIQLIIRKYI